MEDVRTELQPKAEYKYALSGGLHITDAQELFSIAYVTAVCASAGVNHSVPKIDNESVDIELIGSGFPGKWKRPRVLAQLKCTTVCGYVNSENTAINYPLSIKNYNDLRETEDLPKILIVVFCPADPKTLVEWTPLSTKMRFSGYWVNLEGLPEVSNKSTVTVKVPFSQPFNNVTLIELLNEFSERGLV